MPWISPPSRFLGAKGATRPRPVPGEFRLVSAGARRRDREFLRDPGPPVYMPPTAVGGIESPRHVGGPVIVDAYSHVCPERLLDAISERHPSTEVAA
jgi:hypothetical protein